MKLETTEKVPTWAINYLEYGMEASYDLSEEEIQEIDSWIAENFPNGYVCDFHFEDNHFSVHPLFGGMATDVVTTDFYSL